MEITPELIAEIDQLQRILKYWNDELAYEGLQVGLLSNVDPSDLDSDPAEDYLSTGIRAIKELSDLQEMYPLLTKLAIATNDPDTSQT